MQILVNGELSDGKTDPLVQEEVDKEAKFIRSKTNDEAKYLWKLSWCKKTGWIFMGEYRKEITQYNAKLTSLFTADGYTTVDVVFTSRHPYKKIKAACAEKRTVDEMIFFLQSKEREEKLCQ